MRLVFSQVLAFKTCIVCYVHTMMIILISKANQLTTLCVDLFLGGTETTASTVGFALRYLIKFPEIQEKARQELYSVVGKERLPSTEDMPK
jgi:hypothetical protein